MKIFREKQFKSVSKEAYGILSNYMMVTSILTDSPIYRYKISTLFTLTPLDASYSRLELRLAPISYVEAYEKEQKKIDKIVRQDKEFVYYQIPYCSRTFVAKKSLLYA